MKPIVHSPSSLYFIDATLDESDSFAVVSNYAEVFPFSYHYPAKDYGLETIINVATTFSVLHGRVYLGSSISFDQTINSTVPIDVLRYKMLPDGSWYTTSSVPGTHKEGYIVEGAMWSNGFYHLTREEKSKQILDIHLFIDQMTKDLYKYS